MITPANVETPVKSMIQVIGSGYGHVGYIVVTDNKDFIVEGVTDPQNIAPLQKRLDEILEKEYLSRSMPDRASEWLRRGDESYYLAVAEELGHHKIANLDVWGKVIPYFEKQ